MDGAKPVSTAFATTIVLSKNTVHNHEVDSTLYRRLVGALQYLTWTRPDISFSVNKLSQFMQSPTAQHWDALKCLLRYLKSTYDYGVMIKPQSRFVFHAYSDADWARDPTDRHQLLGILCILEISQSHGLRRNRRQLLGLPLKLSTEWWLPLRLKLCG